MKYTENIEPLNDEEKKTKKRDFFFIIVFYVFFVLVLVIIISSFDHSNGGDFFVYGVLAFIGCVALFIFITFLRDFLSNEKIVQRGTITDKEIIKDNKQNVQRQFYFFLDSKEIPVSPTIFTEYAVGDTVEISRTRYSKNIIGARILLKRDSAVSEDNERKQFHTHSTRRSALQFDRQELLEGDERILLMKQLIVFLLKRLPPIAIIWFITPLVLFFLMKTSLFKQIETIIHIDYFFVRLCCTIAIGIPLLKKPLLIIYDLYNKYKLVEYKTVASIANRYFQTSENSLTAYVVFDDDSKEKIRLLNNKQMQAGLLLEIHKTMYSKIILRINHIE